VTEDYSKKIIAANLIIVTLLVKGGPIKHVFVLMLENRSFDHMLGFSKITGVDVDGTQTSVDGVNLNTMFNVNPAFPNVKVPPHEGADFKLSKPQDDDPGHEFLDTLVALCGHNATYNGGNYPPIDNSGFIAEYATMQMRNPNKLAVKNPDTIMNCYSSNQLPVLNALASEFVICDHWFSSMPGPTWPNRFFMHAASSAGLDDSPSGFQSVVGTLTGGYRFENGTIFDRLDKASVEWRIYAGDSFPVSLAISGMTLNWLRGRFRRFEEFNQDVNDPKFSVGYTFIEPNYGNDLPPSAEDFTCGNSQHPLDDVTRGERLIKQVYETIRNSPHWESSLLLVTYDEHGGFYDHVVPPPTVAPGDTIIDKDNNHHNFTFTQLGVRVPAIVISPLIPRNIIDHTWYDHTSLLATVEQIFGLEPLTKRDATAKSFNHLISLSSARTDTPPVLPEPAGPAPGFHCDDDPSLSKENQQSSPGIDQRWKEAPLQPGVLNGFLHVALLKSLATCGDLDKPRIISQFLTINTMGAAREFIWNVALKRH
jgi:phospholipase C